MTNSLRIIFMGTPEFAVPSLAALHQAGTLHDHTPELVAIFTQPDRPAGRGNKLAVSAVKQYALDHTLSPILQPESFGKEPEMVEQMRLLAPDLVIVAAYGLLLPKRVLEIPKYGCINVHASLLPAYRGASPISAAILAGLPETGISIMLMDVGLDTGPVLRQAHQPINPDDTTESLAQRMAEQGAALLLETLPDFIAGKTQPIPQSELPGEVSIVGRVEKEAGQIDWSLPAQQIERMTRAYAPWPSAYTFWRGEMLKIHQAKVIDGSAHPGEVVKLGKEVAIGTGRGLLQLITVQPAGKKAMEFRNFVNGAHGFVGTTLGKV